MSDSKLSPDDTPVVPEPSSKGYRKPWYQSTAFLFLVFFLLMVLFCSIGVIPYLGPFSSTVRESFEQIHPLSQSTGTPQAVASPGTSGTASTVMTDAPLQPALTPEAEEGCTIIWVEYPFDLGKKSRARVWEEIVAAQVSGSGMTPRKFYDLVVEHNPDLVADDYEFKKGKTYLLPECR